MSNVPVPLPHTQVCMALTQNSHTGCTLHREAPIALSAVEVHEQMRDVDKVPVDRLREQLASAEGKLQTVQLQRALGT